MPLRLLGRLRFGHSSNRGPEHVDDACTPAPEAAQVVIAERPRGKRLRRAGDGFNHEERDRAANATGSRAVPPDVHNGVFEWVSRTSTWAPASWTSAILSTCSSRCPSVTARRACGRREGSTGSVYRASESGRALPCQSTRVAFRVAEPEVRRAAPSCPTSGISGRQERPVRARGRSPSLALLTTHRHPERRPFTTTGETSTATALAARLAAQILADRPQLWPETVRALIVHSAEWTPAMRAHLAGGKIVDLLRRYGFGVPSLDRARRSLDNDVTLVIERSLQPFRTVGSEFKCEDMVLHRLPWPRAILRSSTPPTLSYGSRSATSSSNPARASGAGASATRMPLMAAGSR